MAGRAAGAAGMAKLAGPGAGVRTLVSMGTNAMGPGPGPERGWGALRNAGSARFQAALSEVAGAAGGGRGD